MLKRSNGIRILASREEYALMQEAARQDGLPVATWARRVLLREGRKVKEEAPIAPPQAVKRSLSRSP